MMSFLLDGLTSNIMHVFGQINSTKSLLSLWFTKIHKMQIFTHSTLHEILTLPDFCLKLIQWTQVFLIVFTIFELFIIGFNVLMV